MTCGPNRRNILTRSQNLGDRDVDDSYGVPGSSVVEYINSNVKGSKLINIFNIQCLPGMLLIFLLDTLNFAVTESKSGI